MTIHPVGPSSLLAYSSSLEGKVVGALGLTLGVIGVLFAGTRAVQKRVEDANERVLGAIPAPPRDGPEA